MQKEENNNRKQQRKKSIIVRSVSLPVIIVMLQIALATNQPIPQEVIIGLNELVGIEATTEESSANVEKIPEELQEEPAYETEQTTEEQAETVTEEEEFEIEEPDYVVTFNTSAYCECYSCSEGYGRSTSSGNTAMAWHTVAAGGSYPFGTKIYIPYFADAPNGGWFVVEDRGGAISNSYLDIFMDAHYETEDFGRRYLEGYVYYP